jgi:hypothetical protein
LSRIFHVRLLLLLLAARLVLAVGALPEDQLKAATVLTFLRYTEWCRPTDNGVLTVGVLGRAAMVQTLEQTIDGKTVNARKVRVIPVKRPADCQGCQILYLAVDNRGELKQLLDGMRTGGLLVIGESDHFLELGGTVSLLIVDGHMSFEVSQEALERSGLAVSSTLLRYGQVRGRTP